MKNVISLCSKTITHFKNILKKTNNNFINIGVKGGGCNGLKYYIEPTNEPPSKIDEQMIVDNIKINICGHSLIYLIGTKIEWKEDIMGTGLTFNNPNANGKCGCGETFSI